VILLCGIPREPPMALAIAAARAARLRYAVLDQRHLNEVELVLRSCARGIDGALTLGGRTVSLDSIRGVFARLIDTGLFSGGREHPGPPGSRERARTFFRAFTDWLEVAPCRVLNRVGPMGSNASKPFQAGLIRASGFAIPETLVTNQVDAVREFARRHGRVIFKSVSSVRSIVRELTPAAERRLGTLRNLPTQFQEFVPGVNVRVHVVGERLFATEIETEAVDYRYARRDDLEVTMRPIALDARTSARCLDLSRRLDLPLCGIDFKRTPDGRWVCFEVNPTPAYSYYEEQSGQPIARAVVDHLAGRAP